MRVKTFQASEMSEALNMVKAEMGLDAMIISTKKERKKGVLGLFGKPYFEVTAAIEPRPPRTNPYREQEREEPPQRELSTKEEFQNSMLVPLAREVKELRAKIDALSKREEQAPAPAPLVKGSPASEPGAKPGKDELEELKQLLLSAMAGKETKEPKPVVFPQASQAATQGAAQPATQAVPLALAASREGEPALADAALRQRQQALVAAELQAKLAAEKAKLQAELAAELEAARSGMQQAERLAAQQAELLVQKNTELEEELELAREGRAAAENLAREKAQAAEELALAAGEKVQAAEEESRQAAEQLKLAQERVTLARDLLAQQERQRSELEAELAAAREGAEAARAQAEQLAQELAAQSGTEKHAELERELELMRENCARAEEDARDKALAAEELACAAEEKVRLAEERASAAQEDTRQAAEQAGLARQRMALAEELLAQQEAQKSALESELAAARETAETARQQLAELAAREAEQRAEQDAKVEAQLAVARQAVRQAEILSQQLKAQQAEIVAAQNARFEARGTGGHPLLEQLSNELMSEEVAEESVALLMEQLRPAAGEGASLEELRTLLPEAFSRVAKCAGSLRMQKSCARVMAMVGPTGVGKTTTIAKLAAMHALSRGAKVALITTDNFRVGAIEQLKTYAKIMDLPLEVVVTSQELGRAIEKHSDKDLILIDTAGRSQKDVDRLNELKGYLEGHEGVEVYLCVSASTRGKEIDEIVANFGVLPIAKLLFTKIDESASFGEILNANLRHNLPLSYFTTGQKVPEDIEVATPRKLAQLVMKESAQC